jgi:hypothetical protein
VLASPANRSALCPQAQVHRDQARGGERPGDVGADIALGAEEQAVAVALHPNHLGKGPQHRLGVAADRLDLDDQAAAVGRAELLDGAARHQPSADEDADAVADGLHLAEQMGGEQHRHPALGGDTPDQLQHLRHALRVDADGRLVQNQHVGVLDQGVGDAEALEHAARVGRHRIVGPLGEADLVQQRVDAALGVLRGDAVEPGGVVQILPAGEVGVEPDRVGQVADLPFDRDRLAGWGPGPRSGPSRWSAR